jgi:O-antigen/teichoic acid export membrane protein
LLGLLFSWVITKKFSVELWGEITQITIWVSIATHLCGWGNTEYLLKEFSAKPSDLKILWQKCLRDRLPILLITCCVIAVYFRNTLGLIIAGWCIIEYIYQSYDPVISFYKKFMISVWAEIAGAIVLFLSLFIFRSEINVTLVITFLMLADLVKTIVVIVYFSGNLLPGKILKPNFRFYAKALSFFLLGFIGLIEARADLIYVTTYLGHKEIAFYQIASTFFLFTKGGAAMLILPFVPAIYRLKKNRIYGLSLKFTAIGILLSLCSFVAIYFILTIGYKFQVELPFMLCGLLSIIPAFYTYTFITVLFREHKQNKVVMYGIIGIVVNIAFSAILIPRYGTLGAIAAAAIAQWVLVPLYLYEVSPGKA